MVRGRNTPIMCLMSEEAARWLSATPFTMGMAIMAEDPTLERVKETRVVYGDALA